jgi:hypothetical protein
VLAKGLTATYQGDQDGRGLNRRGKQKQAEEAKGLRTKLGVTPDRLTADVWGDLGLGPE